jgi:hypothetical protein
MKSRLLAVLLLFAAVAADAAAPGFKDYTNARFGFKISYPATLIAGRDPTNGAGREFHSKDKEFSLATFAHFLNGETLDSMWQDELKVLGDNITYKKKDKDWYVVSGAKDGTEFYHKTYVQGGNYASFHITYPHAKAKQYDPIVEKIAKSFVPFLKGGDYDRAPAQ